NLTTPIHYFSLLIILPPPTSTLFPYTTLFRSADGLPAGDPKRAVPIRISPIGRVHEKLARNLLHGAQHRLIADPASPQGELKHRSEEHTSELQSLRHLVCRLLLEKKK